MFPRLPPKVHPGLHRVAGIFFLLAAAGSLSATPAESLTLNQAGYFEATGVNIMLGSDYYPDGHQGGLGIIQNGVRTATNGDLRLEPTPGQWQPMPRTESRTVDPAAGEIRVRLQFPDDTKNRTGFNPINYPDLKLGYTVRAAPAAAGSIRVIVDLDTPLPAAWIGRVGFNLELYPGVLFGRTFVLGGKSGVFPREAIGPAKIDPASGTFQLAPLASGGRLLVVAPESEAQRLVIQAVQGGDLALLDGRAEHNNGWFVVRAAVAGGKTKNALEWIITPHGIPGWRSPPVVQVSQVGYHPDQPKLAVIELDDRDAPQGEVTLLRVAPSGGYAAVLSKPVVAWGKFLRYRYARFDFSAVQEPGMYVVRYGNSSSSPFAISPTVYEQGVWQPTVGTFLAVQMCHMRVNDRYRVWHGLCHADDALMAPVNHNHFDGYAQGPSTLTRFKPGEHVPGLDRGGWHDAGDYDLRIESQADTVQGLALAWELFHPRFDNTTIDETARTAELFQPDGKPDVLQQVEHGVLSIVGGYNAMGRLYRGMQDASLRQYTHLGDAATMTDNRVFHDDARGTALKILANAAVLGDQREPAIPGLPALGSVGAADDRWVFTEVNPDHELDTASALAAAARVLKGYNDPLAAECRRIALALWKNAGSPHSPLTRLAAAIDLLQTTGQKEFADAIVTLAPEIIQDITSGVSRSAGNPGDAAGLAARSLSLIPDPVYQNEIRAALRVYRAQVDALARETPYGLPYRPDIWGAGWLIERFGVDQYFLHAGAPDIFPPDYMFNALNFLLGCHPGSNPASFVSGVGAKSMTTAYGANRADWSYIPGGIVSGTALIRPDFPELLDWPYLWQQGEYCLGRPTSDYVFLVLAVDHELKGQPSIY